MNRTLLIILAVIVFAAAGIFMLNLPKEQGSIRGPAQVVEQAQDLFLDQPVHGDESAGYGLISFQVQDIYGDEYTQDIFKDYSMTLVNVWGTYCGPCLDEMPALGELYDEYAAERVNIVGIVIDVQDEYLRVNESQRSLAQEIAEKTGADYTHLLVSEEMIDPVLSKFNAIPASFFVDDDGNIISEFYIGSRSKEDWADIIETNLENL